MKERIEMADDILALCNGSSFVDSLAEDGLPEEVESEALTRLRRRWNTAKNEVGGGKNELAESHQF